MCRHQLLKLPRLLSFATQSSACGIMATIRDHSSFPALTKTQRCLFAAFGIICLEGSHHSDCKQNASIVQAPAHFAGQKRGNSLWQE